MTEVNIRKVSAGDAGDRLSEFSDLDSRKWLTVDYPFRRPRSASRDNGKATFLNPRQPLKARSTSMLPCGRHFRAVSIDSTAETATVCRITQSNSFHMGEQRSEKLQAKLSTSSAREGWTRKNRHHSTEILVTPPPVDLPSVKLFLKQNSATSIWSRKTVTSLGSDSRPSSSGSIDEIFAKECTVRQVSPSSADSAEDEHIPTEKATTNNIKSNTRLVMPHPSSAGAAGSAPKRHSAPQHHSFDEAYYYMNNVLYQIDASVYIGAVDAIYNLSMLCKHNIGYIVDLTNVETSKVPPEQRSDCPCLCSKPKPHSRVVMTLSIDQNYGGELAEYFEEVNELIEKAHLHDKAVLIGSFDGRNRCAAFAVQYLMKVRSIDVEAAEAVVRGSCPTVNISENFYKQLRKWKALLTKSANKGAETRPMQKVPEAWT